MGVVTAKISTQQKQNLESRTPLFVCLLNPTQTMPIKTSSKASWIAAKRAIAQRRTPKKGKGKRKKKETYAIYIYKVLKQVHPGTGVSSKAMAVLNSFVNDIFNCCY